VRFDRGLIAARPPGKDQMVDIGDIERGVTR
jgi:hypothetical protein